MRRVNMGEFASSFAVNVRQDGDFVDSRDATARKLCSAGLEAIIAYEIEPSDLAVIFSGCVGVQDPSCLDRLRQLKSKGLLRELNERVAHGTLPHVAEDGHPAERLFRELIAHPMGVTLYVEIVSHLAEARTMPSYRPHLFLTGAPRPAVPGPAPLITALEDDEDSSVSDEASDDDVADEVYNDDMMIPDYDNSDEHEEHR